MGRVIARPRVTARGWALIAAGLLGPVLLVTGLMDLAMQLLFGVCTGVWCLAG